MANANVLLKIALLYHLSVKCAIIFILIVKAVIARLAYPALQITNYIEELVPAAALNFKLYRNHAKIVPTLFPTVKPANGTTVTPAKQIILSAIKNVSVFLQKYSKPSIKQLDAYYAKIL